MQRVNPMDSHEAALLPCHVYPFISGRGAHNFVQARTHLKLCCLLHDRLHLPGSLAMQDPFVQALTRSVLPFVEADHIRLDLRSSCASFSELAEIKFDGEAPEVVRDMAGLLDRSCVSVLMFDAMGTASAYAQRLLGALSHLRSRARSPFVCDAIDEASAWLRAHQDSITLDQAMNLLMGTYLHRRFSSIAKLLYSVQGAKVTNCEPVLPLGLWREAFPSGKVSFVPDAGHPPTHDIGTDRHFANEVVMNYFAIDATQIDSLNAEAILNLKREPLTSRYIRELDAAVAEASNVIQRGESIVDALAFAQDRSELIRSAVRRRCEEERRRGRAEGWVIEGLSEAGGVFADLSGIGPIARGLAYLARRVARTRPELSWLDYTSSPLSTHVSRFQDMVIERRG